MLLVMASTLLAAIAGIDPAVSAWVLLASSAGLVGAITLWLTFFPAEAYRRLIARR
jgi:hypothetical protein